MNRQGAATAGRWLRLAESRLWRRAQRKSKALAYGVLKAAQREIQTWRPTGPTFSRPEDMLCVLAVRNFVGLAPMRDPGFILHVQDGQHFFYLANNGQPFGVRNGPYPDEDAATQAVYALRRVIGMHRQRRVLRRASAA